MNKVTMYMIDHYEKIFGMSTNKVKEEEVINDSEEEDVDKEIDPFDNDKVKE